MNMSVSHMLFFKNLMQWFRKHSFQMQMKCCTPRSIDFVNDAHSASKSLQEHFTMRFDEYRGIATKTKRAVQQQQDSPCSTMYENIAEYAIDFYKTARLESPDFSLNIKNDRSLRNFVFVLTHSMNEILLFESKDDHKYYEAYMNTIGHGMDVQRLPHAGLFYAYNEDIEHYFVLLLSWLHQFDAYHATIYKTVKMLTGETNTNRPLEIFVKQVVIRTQFLYAAYHTFNNVPLDTEMPLEWQAPLILEEFFAHAQDMERAKTLNEELNDIFKKHLSSY